MHGVELLVKILLVSGGWLFISQRLLNLPLDWSIIGAVLSALLIAFMHIVTHTKH